MQEVLRRLYRNLDGNPSEIDGKPLRTATLMLTTQLVLYGVPSGRTSDQVAQIEADSLELANCAEWGAGPPEGTDYKLIVQMHDLGKAILKATQEY